VIRVASLATIATLALAAATHTAQAIAAEPPIVPTEGTTYALGTRVTGPCDPAGDPDGGLQSAIEYQGRDYRDLHNDWANDGSPSDGWEIRAVRLRDAAGRLLPRCAPLTLRHPGRYELCVNVPGPETEEVCDRTVHFQAARLVAVPGGPYNTPRARPIQLDGSHSKPARKIKRYDWTFRPGPGCPRNRPLRRTKVSGARPTIVALCSLVVELKVTDRRGQTSPGAEAELTVEPRAGEFEKTPVDHRDQPLEDRDRQHGLTPEDQPWDPKNGGKSITLGINVSACAPRRGKAAVKAEDSDLCPYVASRSREGHGYKVARVNDPGGPFHGFWYVSSTELSIERLALYNPWLRPHGREIPGLGITWYGFNETAPAYADAVRGWWNALRRHEGDGMPGQPKTGHTGAIREAIKKKEHDPRRAIEPVFASRRDNLTRLVDGELKSVEDALNAAEGPHDLPPIWTGRLRFPVIGELAWKVGGPYDTTEE
jgi:hypothetical protein